MPDYRADGGGAVAAVRPGAVLMVVGDAATAAELWSSLSPDAGTAVLERLTADGLSRTPDFALVTWQPGGAVRVIVRGGLEVVAGAVTVSGAAVSTWAEQLVDADRVEISVASVRASDAAWLPIEDGVVAASAVAVPRAAASGVRPAAAAEPSDAEVAAARAEAALAAAVAGVRAAPTPATPAAARPTNPAPPLGRPPAPGAAPILPVEATPIAEQTMAPVDETVVGIAELIRPPEATGSLPEAIPVPEGDVDATVVRAAGDPAPMIEVPGDHDGMTIASADIRRLRSERAASQPAAAAVAADSAVSNVRVRMPDGSFEPLGHEIVLGRSPSVSKVSGGRLPRLVTIGQGDPDISRSHVRLALEGGTVVVTDLHSRNGTLVVAPGRAPVKLRAGEPTPVLTGTVVDLGGGWTIQVVGD